jgi:hypothetical protein
VSTKQFIERRALVEFLALIELLALLLPYRRVWFSIGPNHLVRILWHRANL